MWAPRLPSVAFSSAFSLGNSSFSLRGRAFSVAMIFSRSDWWMISSGPMASDLPQPQATEDQRAAADEAHVERIPRADGVEADQRQGDQRRAQGNHPPATPDADADV